MVTQGTSPSPGGRLALRLSAWSAAATVVAVVCAVPVLANPAGRRAETADAAAQVDRLFAEADRAVDEYNGVAERVSELEAELARRQDRVDRTERAVDEQRRTLGSAAAAHYRAGGLDPALALLLSDSPDAYLARSVSYERMSDRRAGELRELLTAQRDLTQQRDEAAAQLEELTEERAELARHKETVEERLAAANERLAELTAREERAEREERAQREETRATRDAERAQPGPGEPAATEPPATPAVPTEAASGRAAVALAAARTAVGLPYGWGQTGPDSFDCSGLVQWAYAKAGVALPRTSQEQAGAGRRVPLDQAQPGDIVVYRSDASHVGLYAGDGQVVHAPYTGASVRYDPVGMMPVSSVVRP